MQQKSAAWLTALLKSSVEWTVGLDILAADEMTPLEDPTAYNMNATDRLLVGGSMTLDTTAASMRSLQVTLRNSDGRYLVGPKGVPSGGTGSQLATGLVWYNVRYRPWIGLRTRFDASGDPVYDKTYLGIFVLTSPSSQAVSTGAQMQLTLLDKSALLQKPYLVTNATLPTYTSGGTTVGGYAAGTTFDVAMLDLATRGGIPSTRCQFTPSALTLPSDYVMTEGGWWWDHLTKLASSMGYVIYFDAFGNLIRIPDPRTINTKSVFNFSTGASSIFKAVDRVTDFTQTYNHTIVIGGSSTTGTFRGEAQIVDPNSPYHKGQIGDRIVYVGPGGKLNDQTPDPNIGSTAQANANAAIYLAQHVGQQESVSIYGRSVPSFEAYDRFTAIVPSSGLSTDFLVQRIQFSLDTTGMQLDSVKWFAVGS